MTTVPARGIMVSMSVSFTPHLLHPGSRDLCTPWNAPCIPVYRCTHVRDLQLHALDWTARKTGGTHSLPWRLSTKTGRWMHRHMVYTDSAYWDSGAVAARQLANAPVWIKNDWWAYCTAVLWRSYRQSHETELTTVPACYCGCRAITDWDTTGTAAYVAIVTI